MLICCVYEGEAKLPLRLMNNFEGAWWHGGKVPHVINVGNRNLDRNSRSGCWLPQYFLFFPSVTSRNFLDGVIVCFKYKSVFLCRITSSCFCWSEETSVLSTWNPTAVARVPSQVKSCGICGRQSDREASFLRVLRYPLPILIPPNAPCSSIIRG
jgi:hypothetical protein